ncbi:MAG: hypothetical protein KGQ88_05305 [Chloroflexi bacterium]|nr:hypothetical protein [Chloroflexota bacterium]
MIIREVSGERFMNITGPEVAFYGHVFGVQSSVEEERAFFDRELRKLGWTPDFGPILSSGEADGWGWCKPRMYYRLSAFDPQQYDRVGVADGAKYATVIDARLQGTLDACPHTPRPFPTPVPTRT